MAFLFLLLTSMVARAEPPLTPAYAASATVERQTRPANDMPESVAWWCLTGEETECSEEQLASPATYRQIAVLPAGFTEDEYALFRDEVSRLVNLVGKEPGTVYTTIHKSRLLYVAFWLPGPRLGSGANFGARVAPHPFRNRALALDTSAVVAAEARLKKEVLPRLDPLAVAVLYNWTTDDVLASSSPPSFLAKQFGISRFSRADLGAYYTPAHELGHAALNLLDEYTEEGLENLSIRSLDALTPLAELDGAWGSWARALDSFFGTYSFAISEILAANGSDNVDVTRYPSRVATAGYEPSEYEYEGGVFFGKGTFHHRGNNLMNHWTKGRPSDDGFEFDHTPPQLEVIAEAFDQAGGALRPNDRLRTAGPHHPWMSFFGNATTVMLYDGDKNHRFHPTRSYAVQVGWYDRHWSVCWEGPFPYPCHTDAWTTAEKTVLPGPSSIRLKSTALYGLTDFVHGLVCRLGFDLSANDGKGDLCATSVPEIADELLPTVEFPLPYQEARVPTTQWWTRYFWRFRSDNGTWQSGWTGWDTFYRCL